MPDKKPEYPGPMKGLDFEPVDRLDNKGKKVKASKVPDTVIIMPKLNGVRMRWDIESQCLRTNNGNKIYSCDHIVQEIHDLGLSNTKLDGEAYHHDREQYSFSYLNGKVRRKQSSTETAFIQYHIYDLAMYDDLASKRQRLNYLATLFNDKSIRLAKTMFRVPYCVAESSGIEEAFKVTLGAKYEGIMICDPSHRYTEGKGKWMWKYKPSYDAEFAFDGFEAATEGRNMGTFAAIRLMMENGITFTCSGINDDMRQQLFDNPPPKGQPITVEYGDLSDIGIPIFPRFKAVRYDQ